MTFERSASNIILAVISMLIGTGILGGIALAVAQSRVETRVETAEQVLADNQPIIDSVDVVTQRVGRIEEDVKSLRDEVGDLDDKMDRNQTQLLDAIRAAK